MSTYLANNCRVFNAGNDLNVTSHSLQVVITISNTRFSLCAQVIDARHSVGVRSCFSFGILAHFLLPRLAGVTSDRYLLRDELLNDEIFYTLKVAQIVIENWRQHYNTLRPHSSLGYCPPAPEVAIPKEMKGTIETGQMAA